MATRRNRWPDRAEEKRVAARELSDEASQLIHEGNQLLNDGKQREGQLKFAEARALNERISRLLAEARHPEAA